MGVFMQKQGKNLFLDIVNSVFLDIEKSFFGENWSIFGQIYFWIS